jgi:hypothetical protein
VIKGIPVFCVKRIIFALGTAIILQPIAGNIMIYIYASLFSLGFNLSVKPLSSPTLNCIDNINELFVLISSYFLMAFSDWIYTPTKE